MGFEDPERALEALKAARKPEEIVEKQRNGIASLKTELALSLAGRNNLVEEMRREISDLRATVEKLVKEKDLETKLLQHFHAFEAQQQLLLKGFSGNLHVVLVGSNKRVLCLFQNDSH